MKKILVINTKYRNFGGEDSNIQDELKFLKSYFDVEYLEFNNGEKLRFVDILTFIFLYNPESNFKLKKLLKNFQPDYVYVHNLWFKPGARLLKLLNRKNFITYIKFHNYRSSCANSYLKIKHLKNENFCKACNFKKNNTFFFNKYYKYSFLKSIYLIRFTKKYIKYLNKYKFKVLVLNNFQKNYIKDNKLLENEIDIYYNPILLKDRNKHTYNAESKYIIYAGNISEEKGTLNLLEIWNNINLPGVTLKLVGNIDPKININTKIKNVEILEFLKFEEIIELIKNARALITATKMYEGQPRVLCEASILGVPSIYPSTGGLNEYFPNDYCLNFEQYNYADLKDKILLLEHKQLLNKLSRDVYEFSNNLFSYQNQLSKLFEVLNFSENS